MANIVHSLSEGNENPFDQIRKVDEHGHEYWVARELMPLLGYSRWSDFKPAIERAMLACQNTGNDRNKHFSGMLLKSNGRNGEDYKLSRYACYLTAMNSDPRKPAIAMAQTYFAIKTREAELNVVPQPTEAIAPSYVEELLRRSLSRTSLSPEHQEIAILRGIGNSFPQLRSATDEAVQMIQESIATPDRHISPTDLGKLYAQKYGLPKSVSGQRMNEALEFAGLQYSTSRVSSSGEAKKTWHLTEAGKEFGVVFMERVSNAKDIEKVRWLPSVIDRVTIDLSKKVSR
ncbi:hypothetical protein WA1_18935 [Scytonema hofmannii PCC 7110]|uniref:Bro-N domain-containing protein n=1 Tax=Scytonema hofmannii PCC 7110 TaxID=128403 RepID=A0A139XBL3_9CYAN|nr:BRO family protein [Scytonema hofmannii]KYC42079.1 hypothetical protein WA1_18935 [Scytonema hofmannii PCC 7110]